MCKHLQNVDDFKKPSAIVHAKYIYKGDPLTLKQRKFFDMALLILHFCRDKMIADFEKNGFDYVLKGPIEDVIPLFQKWGLDVREKKKLSQIVESIAECSYRENYFNQRGHFSGAMGYRVVNNWVVDFEKGTFEIVFNKKFFAKSLDCLEQPLH